MTEQQKLIRKIAIGVAVAFLALLILPIIIGNGFKAIIFLLLVAGIPALMIGGFMLMNRVIPPDPLPHDRNIKRGARVISSEALQLYLSAKQRQSLKESGKPESLPRLTIAGVELGLEPR